MLLRAQPSNKFCRMVNAQDGHNNSELNINTGGLLVCRSRVNEALQFIFPPSPRKRIFLPRNHPAIAGQPGQDRMYDTLRHEFYWSHMAADVEHIVSKCQSCAQSSPIYRRKQKFQLFPVADPLKFNRNGYFWTVFETTQNNQHILVVTNC